MSVTFLSTVTEYLTKATEGRVRLFMLMVWCSGLCGGKGRATRRWCSWSHRVHRQTQRAIGAERCMLLPASLLPFHFFQDSSSWGDAEAAAHIPRLRTQDWQLWRRLEGRLTSFWSPSQKHLEVCFQVDSKSSQAGNKKLGPQLQVTENPGTDPSSVPALGFPHLRLSKKTWSILSSPTRLIKDL